MQIRLAAELQKDSIVDGLGIRTVIWTQGCSHNCKGCHNPSTHDFNGGGLFDIDDVKSCIKKLEGQDGITFSGGDPMFQAEACYNLARYAKGRGLDTWCYTGFTIEELLEMSSSNKYILKFLEQLDVLVDGKFDITKKSYSLKFRGSSNQRVIDVKNTLKCGSVVLLDLDDGDEISFDYLGNGVFV